MANDDIDSMSAFTGDGILHISQMPADINIGDMLPRLWTYVASHMHRTTLLVNTVALFAVNLQI